MHTYAIELRAVVVFLCFAWFRSLAFADVSSQSRGKQDPFCADTSFEENTGASEEGLAHYRKTTQGNKLERNEL